MSNPSSRFLLLTSHFLLLLVTACSSKPPETRDYAAKIAADRAAKDSTFAAGDDPIPKARHAEFLPLAYFPIEPDYNVPAQLNRTDDKTILEMPTSTGTNRKMRRVGTLAFTLKGQPLSLVAFAGEGPRGAVELEECFRGHLVRDRL